MSGSKQGKEMAGKMGLVIGVCALVLGLASCAEKPNHTEFDFVVLADTAYKVPQDYPAYEKLIERINQESPAFSIHLGDVFSGQTNCGTENLMRVKADFEKFENPLVYTLGDNEWTDCHGVASGGYDPLERLANIRKQFFSEKASLGQEKLFLESQAAMGSGLVENALWQKGDVLFATFHIVGSNNGLTATASEETKSAFETRNMANAQWLKEVFEQADKRGAKALVLAYHANIFAEPANPDGFKDMRALIGQYGDTFGKPVLLLHGDHHQFVVDRPYLTPAKKAPGANIIRLQTYGWPDAKAVKIHVDTSTEGVFSFGPLYAGDGFY